MVRLANCCFASQTRSALRFSLVIRKVRCRSNLDGAHLLHSCLGPNPQVTVGGVGAVVTAFVPNAYNLLASPFPLQSVAYTIPPGTSGSAVHVAVTTSAGSTTAAGASTYLPSIQQFPLTGSTLAQGIYDPYTDFYYFTTTSQLQVFYH